MCNLLFVLVLAGLSAVSAVAFADSPETEATPQGKTPCVPAGSAVKYLSDNGYKPVWVGHVAQTDKAIQNTFMIVAKYDGEWIALNAPVITGQDGKIKSEIVCISGHGVQGITENPAASPPPKLGAWP
jgi:hypothetical protein